MANFNPLQSRDSKGRFVKDTRSLFDKALDVIADGVERGKAKAKPNPAKSQKSRQNAVCDDIQRECADLLRRIYKLKHIGIVVNGRLNIGGLMTWRGELEIFMRDNALLDALQLIAAGEIVK